MAQLPKTLLALAMLIGLLAAEAPAGAAEGEAGARSTGQRIYVPIYSTIRYRNDEEYAMAVTISIRPPCSASRRPWNAYAPPPMKNARTAGPCGFAGHTSSSTEA